MDSPVAIVGLGALFPGAKTVDQFWRNILSKTVSIRPLPGNAIARDLFYRPELLASINKQDKTVTDIGGWIEDLAYDTVRKHKIPPSVAEHMDENQHAALYVAGQALAMNDLANVARDKVAVIFGNGMVGARHGDALYRVHFAMIERELRGHPLFQQLPVGERDQIVAEVAARALAATIPITEDSAPGILPNIIAARIASVYDFHGPSFTVDAACASVLAAVISGMQGLRLREYDAVICGGADMPLKELGFVLFSALNALSPTGSYPFDKAADGFVMAQGAGAIILKRLEDAVAAGDRIYAVITGWGQASDGKGKSIAAPNAEWQAVAVEKAMRMAGYSPDTVEMVEAHGTATKVGDVVEVQGLKSAWTRLGATGRGYCGLTSVKSNIGHLKSAAGIAGLIKAALALENKVLPPTAGFREVNPKLELDGSPFYVIEEARAWEGKAHPRRANVSSFGFGGADYHLALQEHRAGDFERRAYAGVETPAAQSASDDIEVVFFSGRDKAEAETAVRRFAERAGGQDFADACAAQNYLADASAPFRLAFTASSPADLLSRLDYYGQNADKAPVELLRNRGIYEGRGPAVTPEETALLFPGQASQYVGMFRGLSERYDTVRTWFRRADAVWAARHGEPVSAYINPPGGESPAALDRLRQTENAHAAIFVTSIALHDLLRQMGLEARHYAGHSLGEIVALAAAGALAPDDALRLVEARGYAFKDAPLPDRGKMISVGTSRDEAEALVRESGLDVHVANVNSLRQTIVAGASAGIDAFAAFLEARKLGGKLLYVSHAFHTPLMAPVADAFHKAAAGFRFRAPGVSVMMNHTGAIYPTDAEGLAQMPALLRDQILAPVDFARSLQKLAAAGVRLFVEVGPGAVLSGLAKDTLGETGARVLTANHRNSDDVAGLRKLLAALFAEGVPIKPVAPARASAPAAVAPAPAQPVAPQLQPQPVVPAPSRTRVVYSGVAVGLPGSWKPSFRDDNFDQLFSGQNLIERLTDAERQRFVDLQISKLVKDESGPAFKMLTALDDVIQLAGKIGRLDPVRDYRIDEKVAQNMSSAIAHGVAAGYEALADAAIPLVREYTATSTGKLLPGKLALPREMQDETGVIFANGFPLVDPVIREVSRYVAYQYGSKTRVELMAFYESLIQRVKDPTARKLLTDWYALYYSRLTDNPGEEEVFRFNHHFMTQISAQANNLLAFLINARGPNFQMNAACSSTSNAITIAEDFIRRGRVKRMLVVGADDPSSSMNFPLLGAGFLCTGAATSEADLARAAVPFDRRRNGMIVGAGAVGIVLEAAGEAEARGVAPVAELLATHSFNTAKHVSQIDPESFSRELDRFLCGIEQETGLRRDEIARQAIYISHETYTPPRGGCSQTEADALRCAFGESFREIIVGNTKGMTGHTMGASLEDAVAARALQDGKCPPVVNLSDPDPLLGDLWLWQGGTHDRKYALKMSAGFGAQGHFALLGKMASGPRRIADEARYDAWLRRVTGDPRAETERAGRLLVVREGSGPSFLPPAEKKTPSFTTTPAAPAPPTPVAAPAPSAPSSAASDAGKDALLADALRVFAEVTKYSADMLDPDMEMEADLGIDTVKQATILSLLGEKYQLDRDASVQLSNYPTIRRLVDLIYERGAAVPGHDATVSAPAPTPAPQPVEPAPVANQPARISPDALIDALAGLTGYPPEMLEPEMEFGPDLGIAAEKRAQIAQQLAETFGVAAPSIDDHTTVGALTAAVMSAPSAPSSAASDAGKDALLADALRVFAEVTKYSADMLDPDMEMEADLGIDTVKQATILSLLGEKYQLDRDASVQLSNYPTIRRLVDLIYERGAAVPGRDVVPAPAPAPTPAPQPVEVVRAWESNLSRQVPTLVDAPRAAPDFDLRGKLVWLLADGRDMAEQVAATCRAAGAEARIFCFAEGELSIESVQARFAEFAGEQTADALIDLTHWGAPRVDLAARLFLSGEARFAVVKLINSLGRKPARILCATAGDGSFGLDDAGAFDPWCGALAGFYKSLRKEWAVETRIADIDPLESPEHAAETILAELQSSGPGVEVALGGGPRRIVRLENRERAPERAIGFSSADTFLITGGATGVTAQVARALAAAYPANFIVVDVAEIPEHAAELAGLDDAGWERVRGEVRSGLAAKQEKVTPAQVNREVECLMRGAEAHRNLEAMRAAGRRVEYLRCDVRDRQQLGALLAEARGRLGPVTVIVHGAGVDASHLIGQKSAEEFRRVFTVKAEGAANLAALCEADPLRAVVAFGSIAGRFGNPAQLDYAAANEFVSHWTRDLRRQRPGLHAVTLVWSGWKDVGIAWRNDFVRAHAENSGLNFIEVEQGIRAFMAELTGPTADAEILLHRGLDGFLERGLVDHYLPDFPLIDRVITQGGKIARSYRQFSAQRDGLLDEHRLGKTPILPAVGYAELAVEHFALLEGKQAGYLLRDMTFPAAFKLFREAPRELFVEAAPDRGGWKVEIKSAFRPPKSEQAQVVLHSSATVTPLGAAPALDPLAWPFLRGETTSLPAEQSLMLIQNDGPEQRIILGPLFNDVLRESGDKEPVLIYRDGTVYPTYFPLAQLDNGRYPLHDLLVNPCFLDSIYQACAANLLVVRKRVYLPWHIDELGIVDLPRKPGLYRTYAQVVEEGDEVVGFDIAMLDAASRVRYYARNARFRLINL